MARSAGIAPRALKANWDTRLELRLAEPDAVRVLNTATLFRLARHEQSTLSRASLERWILDAVASKRLIKIVRGLYLNRMTIPPAELAEAAVHFHPGCVVSLQTVLGDSGAWNNYVSMATAIVPFARGRSQPSLGIHVTQAGRLQFRGMPESILAAGRAQDRLANVAGYARATPEAALLHWLYLAASPRSTLGAAPLDIDLEELNLSRLQRLARAMDLTHALESWLVQKRSHDQSAAVVEQTWVP